MKTSAVVVPITLCIFGFLIVTVSSSAIRRRSAEQESAEKYPEIYEALRQMTNGQTDYKRGCADTFAGCAHLKMASQLYNSRRPTSSIFGMGSPGKRNSAPSDYEQRKRIGGCGRFSGCASIDAGKDLYRSLVGSSNNFGANSPGKK